MDTKHLSGRVKEIEKVYLSNHEAASYLGVSNSTLKAWRVNGVIGYYKIGSLIWYDKNEIDKLINNNRV